MNISDLMTCSWCPRELHKIAWDMSQVFRSFGFCSLFFSDFLQEWHWLKYHIIKADVFLDKFCRDLWMCTLMIIASPAQGGSWVSTGDEASRFARYSFRRHFFQHCGFRVVRSVSTEGEKPAVPGRLVNPTVFIPGLGVTGNFKGQVLLMQEINSKTP